MEASIVQAIVQAADEVRYVLYIVHVFIYVRTYVYVGM